MEELISVISKYVKLKKKGEKYVGLCPFHSEKTPSFTADKEKQLFHCFGCGMGGDVITFQSEIKKIKRRNRMKIRIMSQYEAEDLADKFPKWVDETLQDSASGARETIRWFIKTLYFKGYEIGDRFNRAKESR